MKDFGIYRIAPFSETYVSSYDYNSESIGPFRFKSPIPYLYEYHGDVPTMNEHYIYRALYYRKGALIVYKANETLLVTVFPDKVVVTEPGTNRYDVYTPKVEGIPKCLVSVGYVKTYSPCPSVDIPPYRIPFDVLTNKIHLHGKWLDVTTSISICEDIEYYKKLLNTDYDAVYSEADGTPHFI